MHQRQCLAIVPARAGSKRIPHKNKRLLAGKPLIEWTLNSAKGSLLIDEIYVSTDDADIQKIAEDLGIKTPNLRPEELALDESKTVDVVRHVLDEYAQKGLFFDYIILLQPTSPLRTSAHIDEAIRLFIDKKAGSVTSVCKSEHSPLWSNTLPESMCMDSFLPKELQNKRSQDLDVYYRLNGAIYIVKSDLLLRTDSFIADENSFAYVMSNEDSVDIDEPLDFDIAEMIINKRSRCDTQTHIR